MNRKEDYIKSMEFCQTAIKGQSNNLDCPIIKFFNFLLLSKSKLINTGVLYIFRKSSLFKFFDQLNMFY